jgi:hypothetical protein
MNVMWAITFQRAIERGATCEQLADLIILWSRFLMDGANN